MSNTDEVEEITTHEPQEESPEAEVPEQAESPQASAPDADGASEAPAFSEPEE